MSNKLSIIPAELLEGVVLFIRTHNVMLDIDFAISLRRHHKAP